MPVPLGLRDLLECGVSDLLEVTEVFSLCCFYFGVLKAEPSRLAKRDRVKYVSILAYGGLFPPHTTTASFPLCRLANHIRCRNPVDTNRMRQRITLGLGIKETIWASVFARSVWLLAHPSAKNRNRLAEFLSLCLCVPLCGAEITLSQIKWPVTDTF